MPRLLEEDFLAVHNVESFARDGDFATSQVEDALTGGLRRMGVGWQLFDADNGAIVERIDPVEEGGKSFDIVGCQCAVVYHEVVEASIG